MIEEIWKSLEYRYIKLGMYDISNYGRVRNIKTGHIMTPCPSEKGYLMVCLQCTDGRARNVKLHRMVATIFVSGQTKQKNEVNHIDGDKNNCSAINLEWVTRQENIRHGFDNNLIPHMKGELNGMCIFNEEIVRRVCETLVMFKGSIYDTFLYLANNNCDCNKDLIQDIKYKKRWKYISDQYFKREDFKR